jgi:hypothetical protein
VIDISKQFVGKINGMLGYFFKNQSGKIRNMNGKRSSSFPTDVFRTAPNLRRNILSMDIELFIVRMPQVFKLLIILRLDSPNFLRTILIGGDSGVCWDIFLKTSQGRLET